MPGAEPGDRLIDLCGVPEEGFEQRADAIIQVVVRGQSVTLLTDSDAIVRYLLPAAVARGAQCRFAPPQDGVWRVDLAPGAPGRAAPSPEG
ncbi:MAG: hypothetical protein O3B31_04320 [Chloroflexi bacterium]|nr:hypothetical protein [Chloroflexota bacterium]MDA1002564.1 hypothetical protein [Chloroflexota bacterium]